MAPGNAAPPCDGRLRAVRRRAGVDHAQVVLDDLELWLGLVGEAAQPRLPDRLVGDPVAVAELLGRPPPAVGDRRPAQQQHADLRAEPGGEAQRVAHGVEAALGQVQGAEVGVDVAEVRHRRHQAGLQRLDRGDVLDPHAHRVAREPLGVGDHDLVGSVAEHAAQRVDLGGSAAAARGRVGLVRDEHGLGRDLVADDAARLGLADDGLHHAADVIDVEPRAVEGAVGGDGAEHLADGRDAALARGRGALDDDAGRAHPEDHPVAALVERQRGLLDVLVGGRRAGGQEARADPRQQRVGGHVVGGHDHDARAAPRADPVLGDGDGLRRARAGSVDLRVRPACPDQLGELGVAHGERAEQEPAIEVIRLRREVALELADPAVDVVAPGAGIRAPADLAQFLQASELHALGPERLDVRGEVAVAGVRRREDHAGVVLHRVGEAPLVGQLGAARGVLVVLDERDAGVAQRVDAGGDRELRLAPEGGEPVGVDAELLGHVERTGAAGQLDHVGGVVDRLERAAAVLGLDEARDVALGDLAARPRRDHVDELLAVQQPCEVAVVEDLLGAGRADGGAGDHHRLVDRRPPFLDGRAHAGGVEPAQRLVERRQVAHLRMVGEQGHDVVSQHVGGESPQRALGAGLHEHPGARVIQRLQSLDELHRRGDLAPEDLDDLLLDAGPGRVELAVDVRDDRDPRRRDRQPAQHVAQRPAGGGDDLGMERVADGQPHRAMAALDDQLDRLLDRRGRAADHELVGGIDVREDDVAVDLGQDPLDLVDRRRDGGHRPVVLDAQASPSRARGRSPPPARPRTTARRRRRARRTRRASGP